MDLGEINLSQLLRFVDFLANPNRVKGQLAELIEATTTADEARTAADAAVVELENQKQHHAAALARAEAEHANKLQNERAAFARAAAETDASLKKRETAVGAAERDVRAAAKHNEDLQADLTARIDAINRAADPRPFLRTAGRP